MERYYLEILNLNMRALDFYKATIVLNRHSESHMQTDILTVSVHTIRSL